MLRFEELLRLGGVCGAGAGSHDHQPGSGGQAADGQDHLSGRNPFPEGLRHFRPGQALRGGAEGQRGQPPAAAAGPGPAVHRRLLARPVGAGEPVSGSGLPGGPAQNGPLYRLEHKDLQGLPEIHCAGGHLPLQHRRGVHGRDQLPGYLQDDGPGADPDHSTGYSEHHRHYRCGGNGEQPVSGQDCHGYRVQAYPGRPARRPHRQAHGGELPSPALGAPAPDGLLAGGQGLRGQAGGQRPVHHGGHRPVLHWQAYRLPQ